MKLEGKSAVVTGAASGMGRAVCELFVKEGCSVVAVARREERLLELQEAMKDAPGKVVPFAADLKNEENNEAMVDLAVKEFGKLDILINCAGVMDDMSPVGDFLDEKMEAIYAINLYAPLYAMRKAVKVFLEQGNGGNIVNVASLGAFHQSAGVIYCSSKAALVAASKNTAFIYTPDKIRCNVIAPGNISTEIAGSMGGINMKGYERTSQVVGLAPEFGEAEEIAKAALFLASADSGYVNGDVLLVDGGWGAA